MGSKIFLRKYRVSAEEIGALGEPGEFCGASCAVFAAGATAWVETLTTTPTSRPAICENTSANGPSGGCAQPGAAITVQNANDTANAAPRRPKNLTAILPFAASPVEYGTTP